MAQYDEKLKKTVAGFAALLTTVTQMVRTRAAKPALLDAYDDAADQIIDGLRENGILDADLQSIHKALARLRLAFEEQKP
ncbi:MAG TPA: hypothetical protein VH600_03210 [Burkholderiales bacterium]|jgi:hypothetical protein